MLEHLLSERRSCRAFTGEPVPHTTIERILELAQRTPSWCNTQPWQVAITEGQATERFRRGLGEHVRSSPQQPDFPFPKEYRGVYRTRRKECAMALYSSLGIADGDRQASAAQTMKNFELFGAPHIAVVSTDAALGVYGAVDCGLYVQTFLLAAQSLGVAAVPQAALAGSAPYLRRYFGLGDDRRIVCSIAFGRAAPEHPANAFRTTRVGTDVAVQWVS
ncbi:nitroreductase [Tomitella fengzijianii]|uniref:nitroreductase n=1 Tax=Tomitella fengzijianii TaxID=2597660 RepID=UPI00131DAB48|nr:nitroreductase [Tomitella fengzijianii]